MADLRMGDTAGRRRPLLDADAASVCVAVERGACSSGSADGANAAGLQALVALRDLELHPLTLGKALVAIALDLREVHEDVLTTVLLDEAVALLVTEPLDGTFCQPTRPPRTRGTGIARFC